ncbi:MAG: hypothetical protein SFW07_01765, partial [Gammaproteobacteria bacterium]|nr:hypothetical protein [Gammaproteobacteria bacterium]
MLELAHVFFSSLSYIPYALLVYVCLVFAPALAFFPRLTQKPVYFIGIPIISLLINSFFAAVLFKFQWYTHGVVLVLSVGLTGIAVIRQYFYYVRHRFE